MGLLERGSDVLGITALNSKTVMKQFASGTAEIGNIMDMESMNANIAENAIPSEIVNMTVADYDDFLYKRRRLMARMIEEYYKSL